jgi:hypothetical protein
MSWEVVDLIEFPHKRQTRHRQVGNELLWAGQTTQPVSQMKRLFAKAAKHSGPEHGKWFHNRQFVKLGHYQKLHILVRPYPTKHTPDQK